MDKVLSYRSRDLQGLEVEGLASDAISVMEQCKEDEAQEEL